jgi:hypothetical protein
MGKPPDRHESPELQADWEALRSLVRRRVRAKYAQLQPDDLEEICQLALVRVLRALRGSDVRNPEGLSVMAADRAAGDWWRARRRWQGRFESLDPAADPPGGDPLREGTFGDPLERVRFVVTEFFDSSHAGCAELARPFFESRDWGAVAAALGRSHEAVRKQWSRCVALLRERLRGELAPLFQAFRDGD